MAKYKTITAANSIFTLSVAGLYSGVRIEGFSADLAFETDGIQLAETRMGVDGQMSAGWLPHIVSQNISLQADSGSIEVFDTIYLYTQAQREIVWLTAAISVPSTGKTYALNKGTLKNYVHVAPHHRVQEPKRFTIDWGEVLASKI